MEAQVDPAVASEQEEPTQAGGAEGDTGFASLSGGGMILPPTRIAFEDDVHDAIDYIGRARAQALLHRHARFGLRESLGLATALSELTQNIVKHAESAGWATIWLPCPKTMCIVVLDSGVGFAGTLGGTDRSALKAGVLDRCSPYRQPGRGQGLRYVLKWAWEMGASVVFRSGAARIRVGRRGMVSTEDNPWTGTMTMVALRFGRSSRFGRRRRERKWPSPTRPSSGSDWTRRCQRAARVWSARAAEPGRASPPAWTRCWARDCALEREAAAVGGFIEVRSPSRVAHAAAPSCATR